VLRPGDYTVSIRPDAESAAEYRIELGRQDPFTRPVDLEPNDTITDAVPLPSTLAVSGNVGGSDVDWYQFPELSQATAVTFTVDTEVGLSLASADGPLELDVTDDARTLRAAVPARTPIWLRVAGDGPYDVTLAFANGPVPEPEPPPLPVALTLQIPQTTISAYRREGQRLDGGLVLKNEDQSALDLTLDVESSHYGWRPSLSETSVRISAGESRTVPLTVRIAPDAWAAQPVQVSVRAMSIDGAQQTLASELVALRDAEPVAPESVWPLPEEMLGGVNVASSALGVMAR
jgi:hypothetical protein